jgi:4-diphosphocytidyl-2-C-methyl-D-erythritol kinase
MIIEAPAKINLALDVLCRRPDNYHEVDMIMQTIGLADEIRLSLQAELEIVCSHPLVPSDPRNLAWRAAQALRDHAGISSGARIEIKKRIPIAAGLAGGSSDAAATLKGLNRLWNLNLSSDELLTIGVQIGADVPFCIQGGTVRARGIGEKLTPVASGLRGDVLLVTPDFPVPTAQIYRALRVDEIERHPPVAQVVERLRSGALESVPEIWGNVLQEVAFREFPALNRVKQFFDKYRLACLMSGSGPTLFALNPPRETAANLLAEIPAGWFGCLTQIR